MIEERNGVRNWASILDEGTRLQAEKLARCPAVSGPVALMPDAHVGIGATVGSVIVTENAIIPAAGIHHPKVGIIQMLGQPFCLDQRGRC